MYKQTDMLNVYTRCSQNPSIIMLFERRICWVCEGNEKLL